jgi:hypothetical protein
MNVARPRLHFRPGYVPPPQAEGKPKSAPHLASDRQSKPEVIDDFESDIPIGTAELEVLEIYLGHLLDQLFSQTADQPSQDKGESSC